MKEKQTKKPMGRVKEERKFDRDLTPEDIARLQAQIRQEQSAKTKPFEKTSLIDWQATESKDFFANEKKEDPGKKGTLSDDYFNTDYF